MSSLRTLALAVCCVVLIAPPAPARQAQARGESIAGLLRDGDAAGALKRIDEALARSPGDARLWTLRGLALAALKRSDDSLAAYRKALSVDPGYLPALQGAAQIEYRSRQAGARQTLERIIAIDRDNAVAHAMLGALAYERQDCAAALQHFTRAGDVVAQDPQALWQAGHCLFGAGRPAEAAEKFQRIVDSGAIDAAGADSLRFNLALALHTAGGHDRAVTVLEPLAARERPDPEVLSLLADAYAAGQRIEPAVQTLRRATILYPRNEQFYVSLGALCLELDSFELGFEIVEVGLQNVPRSARLHALRGVLHAQRGNFDQAQADFERVAEIEPHQPAAVAGLSMTLQQTGKVEQSIGLLREQVRARPDDPIANLTLAQALLAGGGDEAAVSEAREALSRAIAAAPRLAAARTELGKLLLKAGEMEKAIEQLERAIEIDPADRTATYQLLVALRRAGRPADAQKLVDRVRELLDEEKTAEVTRNRFRLMKGEPDGARQP